MMEATEPKRLEELIDVLGGIRRLQEQLLEIIRAKIEAIRRADMRTLRVLDLQEQEITKRIQAGEGDRRRLTRAVGTEVGLPLRKSGNITVSQLMEYLPPSCRMRLAEVAQGLREVLAEVAQANRIAGALSREVLNHLKWVFASVRPKGNDPVGYSDSGTMVGPARVEVFETVG